MTWAMDNSIIWGSGIVSRETVFPEPHKVLAVRGPLTRERFFELGYHCPDVYGDPALLLPQVTSLSSRKAKRVGIVAHYVDSHRANEFFQSRGGIHLIDVFDPVESVVQQIAECELVVSSSLHGLIVAHAFGVPAAWVEFSKRLWGDGTKFLDHLQAVGLSQHPVPLMIEGPIGAPDLESYVRGWPQPEPSILRKICHGLLLSCPFRSGSNPEIVGFS